MSFEHFNMPLEWIPLAAQENLNISFLGDSVATGKADCNSFRAGYATWEIAGNQQNLPLEFYNISSTKINCSAGSYGQRFLEALAGSQKYRQTGDSLQITYVVGGTAAKLNLVRGNANNNPDVTVRDSSVLVSQLPDIFVSNMPFTILQNGPITNGSLKLGVQFGGGCGHHDFTLFGKVSTGGIEMILNHNSDDPCKALIKEDINLDLSLFIDEYKRLTGKINGNLIFVMTNATDGKKYSYNYQF